MITLIKNFFYALLFDELAARRWLRAFFFWGGGMLISITAYPWEVVKTWEFMDWVYRLIGAAVLGAGGVVTAGQKNLPPEKIQEALTKLDEAKKQSNQQ